MPNVTEIIKNGLLPLLLGCGLFFINIRPYHNWGDDFAQYLQQADNLRNDRAIDHSTYRQNTDFSLIGPEAYPPGFPILLVLSPLEFEDKIIEGQYLTSFFLWLFGWLMFLLLRRYQVPWLLSLILMLSFIYHPWVLAQKSQVLSDIPFAFFVLLALFLAHSERKLWSFVMAGIAAGFAISIRSAGWVIPMAISVLIIMDLFRIKKLNYRLLVMLFAAISLPLAINFILGYQGSGESYSLALEKVLHHPSEQIWLNFWEYFKSMQYFIAIEDGIWPVFVLSCQVLFWSALILGFRHYQKMDLIVLVVLGYSAMILIFPFSAGFRFLLPIFPLLLVLAFSGPPMFSKNQLYMAIILIVFVNILHYPHRQYILSQQERSQEGPQTKEALEVFDFVRTDLKPSDVVVFSKPRALAFYTGIQTAATLWEIKPNEFEQQSDKLGGNYYLTYSEIDYRAMNDFIKENPAEVKEVFRNSKFVLYKKLL